MIKVGRFTAALILLTVGVLLLWDQMSETNYLGYILDWWPVILILLGIEYLWVNLRYQKSERQLRLDVGGVLIAVVIVIGVVGVTQSRWIPKDWLNGVNWESIVNGEQTGKKFEMADTQIPVGEKTDKIVIDNPYGSIVIQTGSVQQIDVKRTVWVHRSDDKGAQQIADGTHLDYSEGNTLTIESKSDINRFARRPTIELVVTVPETLRTDWLLKGQNGKIEAAKLPVKSEIEVDTTNGSVNLSDLKGGLTAHTSNAQIRVTSIEGNIRLTSSNGSITVQDIQGAAELKTSNASISVERVSGDVEAETSNGKITVADVRSSVKLDTKNASISASSRQVGGNWELETSNGRVDVQLPSDGSYEVNGRGESITTNLPLQISEKQIVGKVGAGQYKLRFETSNSPLSVQRAD